MELTDDNLRTLAQYLQQTLSPDPSVRRPAEKFLEGVEGNQNYALLLLKLVDNTELDLTLRIAGSIAFKNYVRRNWSIEEDGADKITAAEREGVRSALVGLMLRAPSSVQAQLSQAVAMIGQHDFPDKWPGLITQCVENFATGDFHVINGVLQTCHSLFKRYRYEFKSQQLWTEIKFVLDNFAKPLTDLFLATLELSRAHATNEPALRVIYSSLLLICKVFHSLNYQDLPEFFEDNMPIWMPNLLGLLQAKVPILDNGDDNEAGVVEKVRAEAVECAALYAFKYGEEFAPHAPAFVTASWGALVDAGPQPKYDTLVSGALCFLANVAEKTQYRSLFEDPATLSSICEKVIIPNIEFREADQELFEDNPEEYMRRDIEGSDVETRRRAACDLVKVLSVNFEERIFEIFGQYVQAMLARHAAAPDCSQWRAKDAALYLVTSLSARGKTQRSGVTSVSALVSLPGFCNDHVLPDLSTDVNATPILKADAIKYVMTFRTLLPKEQLVAAMPNLIRHLEAESGVVASYSASSIEKLLLVLGKLPQLEGMAPNIIHGLMQLMQKPGHQENDYAMKGVMRTLSVLQEACMPALGTLLPQLAQTLSLVTKNPSRPHFNHFLFESLSLSIKVICKANPAAVDSFEDALFPIFQEILQQEVQEFMPYVFQMLSLLLEQRMVAANGVSGDVGGPYIGLVGCLLAPPLWDKTANVRPLVRLLCSLTAAAHPQLSRDNRLNGMLGVFQKLISSKANDHEGFYLIQCILQHFPEETMRPFLKQIITLVFQRLSSSKTTKYLRGLIPFLGFYSVRYGPVDLLESLESVQVGLFGLYCERVLVPELQRVSGDGDKKMAVVGYVKLLCECPTLIEPSQKYNVLWVPILQAVISLCELPSVESSLPEDHWVDVEEPVGYEAAYCQLASTKQDKVDPLPQIGELKQFIAESLGVLSRTSPGRLATILQSMDQEHRTVLNAYLQKFQVQIM